MNLVDFTKNELRILENGCEEGEALQMQKLIDKAIVQVVSVFAAEGHSGFSANYAANLIDRLLRYQPLSPLTGDDDEWIKIKQDDVVFYQNKRFGEVFKREDGTAYWISGKVFSEDEGHTWFTCKESKVDITFPFNVPSGPEEVIIDNYALRAAIRLHLLSFISMYDLMLSEDRTVNDEDRLGDLMDADKFPILEDFIKEEYNVDHLLFPLDEDVTIWLLINLVLDALNQGEK